MAGGDILAWLGADRGDDAIEIDLQLRVPKLVAGLVARLNLATA